MFVLLRVLEADGHAAAEVVVFEEGGQLGLLLAVAHLVVALVLLEVELDVDLDSPGQSSEEGAEFFLRGRGRTMEDIR